MSGGRFPGARSGVAGGDDRFVHRKEGTTGLLLGNKISSSRAEQARALFGDIPKIRLPTAELTERVWSRRHNLGAHDACFIALAESLEVPLITCDDKQVGASGHQAEVHAFSPRKEG